MTAELEIGSDFDDIVVGSSPLMLLVAFDLARSGRSVCVVDSSTSPGGAWQAATLADGSRAEIACHVIEVFPGVYELLERTTGIEFVTLERQPIRLSRSGLELAYLSRFALLLAIIRLLVGAGHLYLRRLTGLPCDANQYLNFVTKLRFFLQFQLPNFWRLPMMKGPKHGFVDFLDRLIERCKAEGAEFRHYPVGGLQRMGTHWRVSSETQPPMMSAHVHVSTSVRLRKVNTDQYESVPAVGESRTALIVEIDSDRVVTAHTYVAFWKDPLISRISRLDTASVADGSCRRFLIETRGEKGADEAEAILARLVKAGIVAVPGDARLVGTVEYLYSSHVEQLASGELECGLFGYYSNGNLAAGIAGWLRDREKQGVPVQ